MTPKQLQLIHTAARQLKLNDAQYHTVLRNVAGVESAKALNNSSFEQVMAFFESSGWAQGNGYWTAKAQDGWRKRTTHKIEGMCQELGLDPKGFCRRMTRGATDNLQQADGRDHYDMIEALKVMQERRAEADASLFPDAAVSSSRPEPSHSLVGTAATSGAADTGSDDIPF